MASHSRLLERKLGTDALHQVPIDDVNTASIYPHFQPCLDFIKRRLDQEGGCVLVHCQQGTSRSVAILVAFLMASQRLTLRAALNFILDRRPPTSPYIVHAPQGAGFLMQLVRWESTLGLAPHRPTGTWPR